MSIRNQIEGFVDESQDYIEARIEHAELKAVDKASSAVSSILSWICIASVMLICVLMITVLSVFLLKLATGSFVQAISIVLAFYLITTVVLIVFRRRILIDPIRNKLLGVYLNKSDDE